MPLSAEAWIAAHAEQAPDALRARLDATLLRARGAPDPAVATSLFVAGRELLTSVLRAGATQREAALDLLTADALVTYAFEGAADDPDSIDARAASAMRSLAAVVDPVTR